MGCHSLLRPALLFLALLFRAHAQTNGGVEVNWPSDTSVPAQCKTVVMQWQSPSGLTGAGMFIEGNADFELTITLPASAANATNGTFSFTVDVPWSTSVAVEIFSGTQWHATTPFRTVQPGSSLGCLSATGSSLASDLGLFSTTTTTSVTTKSSSIAVINDQTTSDQATSTSTSTTTSSTSSSVSSSSSSQTLTSKSNSIVGGFSASNITRGVAPSSSSSSSTVRGADQSTTSTIVDGVKTSGLVAADSSATTSKGASTGAIIGASVGAAVFLAVLGGLAVIWNRDRNRSSTSSISAATRRPSVGSSSMYRPAGIAPSVMGHQYPYNGGGRSDYSPVTVQYGAQQQAWEQAQNRPYGTPDEEARTTPTMRGLPEIMEDRSQERYYSRY